MSLKHFFPTLLRFLSKVSHSNYYLLIRSIIYFALRVRDDKQIFTRTYVINDNSTRSKPVMRGRAERFGHFCGPPLIARHFLDITETNIAWQSAGSHSAAKSPSVPTKAPRCRWCIREEEASSPATMQQLNANIPPVAPCARER